MRANIRKVRLVISGERKSLVQTDHIQSHMKILTADEQEGTELQ